MTSIIPTAISSYQYHDCAVTDSRAPDLESVTRACEWTPAKAGALRVRIHPARRRLEITSRSDRAPRTSESLIIITLAATDSDAATARTPLSSSLWTQSYCDCDRHCVAASSPPPAKMSLIERARILPAQNRRFAMVSRVYNPLIEQLEEIFLPMKIVHPWQ